MDTHRRLAGLNRRAYELFCRRLVDSATHCARCGGDIDPEITRLSRIRNSEYWNHPLGGTAGHIVSVIDAPHLAKEPSNHQVEHRKCNSRDGQRIATQRRNAQRERERGVERHSRDW